MTVFQSNKNLEEIIGGNTSEQGKIFKKICKSETENPHLVILKDLYHAVCKI